MTAAPKIIAIDGPAASGKGTLARGIAEALGYAYLDTGTLYRAVAYEMLQEKGPHGSAEDAVAAAEKLVEKLERAAEPSDILENLVLREDHVAQGASKVAAIEQVRALLVRLQQNFARSPGGSYKGVVMDGRDIGTVICPEAAVKLFITAATETRAKRRYKELQSKGIAVTYEAVLADMRERDARDEGREAAPLKPADDATVLDTTGKDIRGVLQEALAIVKKAVQKDTSRKSA